MINPFQQDAETQHGGPLPSRHRDMFLIHSTDDIHTSSLQAIRQRKKPLTIAVLGTQQSDAQHAATHIRQVLQQHNIKGIKVGYTSEQKINNMSDKEQKDAYRLLGGAWCQDDSAVTQSAERIKTQRTRTIAAREKARTQSQAAELDQPVRSL